MEFDGEEEEEQDKALLHPNTAHVDVKTYEQSTQDSNPA